MKSTTNVLVISFAAACASFGPAASAAPLLTMGYQIGGISSALGFMGDGSVRICDGSVREACDGSVVPNAFFSGFENGSVRGLTSIWLLGDGSVRTGTDRPTDVDQTLDAINLSSLAFSPNPFLAASVNVIDFGDATSFLISFFGPLILGANTYDYELTGDATLTDAEGNDVTAGALSPFGQPGLVAGAVDNVGVAALGAGGLSGPGAHLLATAAGSASCVACSSQALGIGFQASGGGDQYVFNARFDLERAATVPEPGGLALLGLGLAGLAATRRRHR